MRRFPFPAPDNAAQWGGFLASEWPHPWRRPAYWPDLLRMLEAQQSFSGYSNQRFVEEVFSYSFTFATRHKKFVGNYAPRLCRFCGRTDQETTFRKDAHVIPAALGNRRLFSNEECDDCNQDLGSPLEDDLVTCLEFVRILGRGRSRKGRAKMTIPGRQSYLETDPENNQINIVQMEGEDPLLRVVGNNQAEIALPGRSYFPINVCKALARMMLMVVPLEDLANFQHVLAWIKGEIEWLPTYHTMFVPGTGFTITNLSVFRYYDLEKGPIYIVGLLYSTHILLMHIPGPSWELPAPPLPTKFVEAIVGEELPNAISTRYQVLSYEQVEDVKLNVGISFQGVRAGTEPELDAVLKAAKKGKTNC